MEFAASIARVMRQSRFAGVAGLLAMIMAILAVCPCPPVIGAPRSENGHGCCAGAGLTVTPAASSCCSDDAVDPRLAVTSVSVPLVAGWATLDAVIAALPAPSFRPAAIRPAARPAPPPILRV